MGEGWLVDEGYMLSSEKSKVLVGPWVRKRVSVTPPCSLTYVPAMILSSTRPSPEAKEMGMLDLGLSASTTLSKINLYAWPSLRYFVLAIESRLIQLYS